MGVFLVSDDIKAAEIRLGLVFPPSYRMYLSYFGASIGSGFVVYGLPPETGDQPLWVDAVSQTLKDRSIASIPCQYLAVSDDGGDYRFYLKCSLSDSTVEAPVVMWGPGLSFGKIVYGSFLDFAKLLAMP